MKYLLEFALIVALICLVPATYYFGGAEGLKDLGLIILLFLFLAGMLHPIWWPWLLKKGQAIELVAAPEKGTAMIVLKNKIPWNILDATGSHPAAAMKKGTGERKISTPFRDFMNKILPEGLCWVGLWFIYTLHEYTFRWTVLRDSAPRDDEPGMRDSRQIATKQFAVTFEMPLKHINLKPSSYYGEAIGAETKTENMEIDVLYSILVSVVDPELALFGAQSFLTIVHTLIKAAIRSQVIQLEFQQVLERKELDGAKGQILSSMVSSLRIARSEDFQGRDTSDLTLVHYLEQMFGVRVLQLTFEAVVPPDVYAEASTRLAAATQEAATTVKLATAERTRLREVGSGEAEAITAEIEAVTAGGDVGLTVLKTRAFVAAAEAGNMVITGFPENAPGNTPPVIVQPKQQPAGAGTSGSKKGSGA